jgi:PWWP domain
MYPHNRSTSGGLLHPSPQSKMNYHDSHGRKRTAESALDDPTSLEQPSHRPHAPAAAVDQPSSTYDNQPRKVVAPGATQAAIARLSALKAQGRGTPPPSKPITTQCAKPVVAAYNINTHASPQQQQQQQRPKPKSKPANHAPKQHHAPPAMPAAPSGTKVPAPGATQAALARLGSKGLLSNVTPSSLATTQPIVNDSGPRKVPAPGATQAALARLASFKQQSSGSGGGAGNLPPASANVSSHHHHHAALLAPPPHPLFSTNNGGSGTLSTSSAAAAPFTASAADFAHGTIVWAKMQSYPWWPAQVQHPTPDQMRLRHSSSDIFIVFYGTADYSWLPLSELKLFRTNLPEYSKFAAPRNKSLQRAIDQAWVSIGQPRPDVLGKMPGAAVKPPQVAGGHHHHHAW